MFAQTSHRIAMLALVSLSCTLGACQRVKPPSFTAVGVTPGDNTRDGTVLLFHIEASNNNADPLPLRRVTYELSLGGQLVFSGQRSAQISVPEFAAQSFDLPAVVPFDRPLPAGPARYAITGKVQYLEPGRLAEVLFDSEMRMPEAPLSITGTVDLGFE